MIEILVRGQRTEIIPSEKGGGKDNGVGIFPQGLISELAAEL